MTDDPVLGLLLDFSVRAAVVLTPALLFALFSRRSSAAARHAICFAALGVALAIPVLGNLLPSLEVAVLPAATHLSPGEGNATAGILLIGLWLGGAIVVGYRVLGGVVRARLYCRLASEVTDARVLTAAIRVRKELGLTWPIRVLSQRRLAVPLTWGLFRPVVLLPRGAARWSQGRLRAVLLHELTHVRRRDCLTQLVADLVCAVYWFHPLVWFAATRMRAERERACDDSVVVVGGRPSGYAILLLRMVKGIRAGGLAGEPMAAFGDGGGLKGRLRALLGRARDRRALTPASVMAFVAGALTLALPVAAVRVTHRAPEVRVAPTVAIAPVPEIAPPSSRATQAIRRRPVEIVVSKGIAPAPSGRRGLLIYAGFTFSVRVPATAESK